MVMPSVLLFFPFHCTVQCPADFSLASLDPCSSSHSISSTFVASATLVFSASYSNRAMADAMPVDRPSVCNAAVAACEI